jgi:energy-coupling factor transport system substrate-specific component
MYKWQMYKWQLKDIIMVAILSLFFAVIYLGALYLYQIAAAVLAPFGLAPFALQVIYGVWFMAATLAAYIMRKPGVAFTTEVLAATLEILMGNIFGPLVFISGVVQGLGAEAVFAGFRYKRFDMMTMCLAGFGACVLSFGWNFYGLGYIRLAPGLLVSLFLVRMVSAVLLSGVLMKFCGDRLAETGILKSYPLGAGALIPTADK